MKIKRFRSLTFKLTVWYIVILGTIVILAGLFLHQGFKEGLMNDLDKTLVTITDEVHEEWLTTRGMSWEEAIEKAEEEYSAFEPFIQVVEISEGEDRHVINTIRSKRIPEGAFLLDTRTYFRADRTDIDSFIYETVEDEQLSSFPLRVFLFPVRGPRILQVGISLENTVSDLNRLLIVMILTGSIIMLLASLGGSFIINKALHPVKSVVKTAEKITAEDLSLRIDSKNRKDEIGALVETFNSMIARLEKSINKIRQFSGDVSHELRTPLTIIRGEIEVLLRKDRPKEEYLKTFNSVLEESFRMEKLIDALLFLSRVEAMDRSKGREIVDLDDVLDVVSKFRSPSASNNNISIGTKNIKPVQLKGNRELLERMTANILDNAIRYSNPGDHIEIELEKDKNTARLQIRDTGIGIPEESLPLIFDRFYVVDPSRSKETGGAGLGLSIVKWIAEYHHAKITVDSTVGQGTNFIVTFPLD
ncbi:MAG: ATP-binding protein [Candidatus Aminicenantes bacterium]|nr:ATP-binding protein [Candidatus Aminicenantes bacterium]